MTTTQIPIQRTLDELLRPVPQPARRECKLIGEPFVSPVAQIPTNRTPLSPTSKPR